MDLVNLRITHLIFGQSRLLAQPAAVLRGPIPADHDDGAIIVGAVSMRVARHLEVIGLDEPAKLIDRHFLGAQRVFASNLRLMQGLGHGTAFFAGRRPHRRSHSTIDHRQRMSIGPGEPLAGVHAPCALGRRLRWLSPATQNPFAGSVHAGIGVGSMKTCAAVDDRLPLLLG